MITNKLVLYILHHPLVKAFLAILSLFVYPLNQYLKESYAQKPSKHTIRGSTASHKTLDASPRPSKALTTAVEKSPDNLFPETIKYSNLKCSVQPCSTSVSTQMMPYQNEQGEIEWAFTDDASVKSASFNDSTAGANDNISPTISNSSSNNESIMSSNLFGGFQASAQLAKGNHSPKSTSSPSPPLSALNGPGDSNKAHQCPQCEATFKLRGYLTRHLKKHSIKKAYCCPFHKFSVYIDEANVTHQCHPTGGFSRRDTYKTHLKSRHFQYPKGTKTKERAKSCGNCSMCGEFFPNSEIWCEIHIEGGECKFLPAGFIGKSRIKNKLKKEMKRKGIKIETAYTEYSSLVNEIIKQETSKGIKTEENEYEYENEYDFDSQDLSPLSSELSQSPMLEADISKKHQQQPHSTSSVQQLSPPHQQSVSPLQQRNEVQQRVNPPHTQAASVAPLQQVQQQQNVLPSASQFNANPQQMPIMNEYYDINDPYFYTLDYDDEFCLDVDQLNQFTPVSMSSPDSAAGTQRQVNPMLLQQQYQIMQKQMQMNFNMAMGPNGIKSQQLPQQYRQAFTNQHPQPQQINQPPQEQHQYQQSNGQPIMGMNTGLNTDELHIDQYSLQSQYVQY
ncbi:protein with similarity to stp1p [Yamadazyma tenuis]|uniref:C2H2-type domain-containing protein n=1 Tax=Candida tenuis (strain ATCC 10573 / BCRC 21748 / CBS 615 / JCM 9827 / NBRC 10315 / NRRL Y-1498 / VKM Y-70) TaxID=590646 RepID=G3AXL8_CANTC|nr:uncharacterized protein CANTEDRAFT_91960 [Yamadazyma tenuis ATCC 10573]EGV65645.1 hypothetical protein CANTEDRAFT_91960 [Yamadazyma tenuis ATCC 10573]WEJ96045.1 protein with similarity to stp1p [Yamadazyma tenuis]